MSPDKNALRELVNPCCIFSIVLILGLTLSEAALLLSQMYSFRHSLNCSHLFEKSETISPFILMGGGEKENVLKY